VTLLLSLAVGGVSCGGDSGVCVKGQLYCEGKCVDPKKDPKNCGGCGFSCSQAQFCTEKGCMFCPVKRPTLCGTTCVDPNRNTLHCGACKNTCKPGDICRGGECVCPDGFTSCDGSCVDTFSSPNHCGACARACGANESCYRGRCTSLSCEKSNPSLTTCERACIDLQINLAHCGKCKNTCRSDQLCDQGKCLCGPEQKECAGKCVDFATDWDHCGGCGKACVRGQYCANGVCVNSCPKSTPSQCYGGCFDLRSNQKHCGQCGNACGGIRLCKDGRCLCPKGWLDCGNRCVDPRNDENHCGKCDNKCEKGSLCGDGKCQKVCPSDTPTTCYQGCFQLTSHPQHCGACGNTCRPDRTCEDGKCACLPGRQICNNRCVDIQANGRHCGGCGKICKPGQVCVRGTCKKICPEEFPDICYGGCVHKQKDPHYCGSCGEYCAKGEKCCDGVCAVDCSALEPGSENATEANRSEGGSSEASTEIHTDSVDEGNEGSGSADAGNEGGGSVESTIDAGPVNPEGTQGTKEPSQENTPDLTEKVIDTQERVPDIAEPTPEVTDTTTDTITTPTEKVVDFRQCRANPLLGKSCSITGKNGECANGRYGCEPSTGKFYCKPNQVASLPEICDKKDNDCDGSVDEDQICCKSKPGYLQACKVTGTFGDCAQGIQTCKNDLLSCESLGIKGSPEICDKKDNDCDGNVDEDAVCCKSDKNYFKPCQVANKKGACAVGINRCAKDGKSLLCVATQQLPIAEICDKKDNDCDGSVDEDQICCTSNAQFNQPCRLSGTNAPKGPCAFGVNKCENGKIVCKQTVFATTEICDNKDNDCDGQVDGLKVCGWLRSIPTAPYSSSYFSNNAVDASGNVYIAGSFAQPLTFGPTNILKPSALTKPVNGYVAKYDPAGKLLWIQHFSGQYVTIRALTIDQKTGSIYVGGDFKTSATFGTYTYKNTTSRYAVAYIARLEPKAGKVVWVDKVQQATGTSTTFALTIDKSGKQLYLAGGFTYKIVLGPTGLQAGPSFQNAFVARYDITTRKFIWGNANYGGRYTKHAGRIALDHKGGVYIGGSYVERSMHFVKAGKIVYADRTTNSRNVYIAKFDTTKGDFQWVLSMGGTSSESIKGLACDSSGNLYATGSFGATTTKWNFGTIPMVSRGGQDIYVTKISPAGVVQWVTTAGGTSSDTGHGIAINAKDQIYIVGTFLATTAGATFGKTTIHSKGKYDIFVARLDTKGQFAALPLKSAGSRDSDYVRGLAVYQSDLYILGLAYSRAEFDKHTPTAKYGIFLWKTR